MKTTILFPSNPCNNKEIDEQFRLEYDCAKSLFQIELFDYEKFLEDDTYLIKHFQKLDHLTRVIYRGWMLTDKQYEWFYDSLKHTNRILINTLEQYLNCHYFPYANNFLIHNDQQISYTTDLSEEYLYLTRQEIDGDAILKDYVKSEKGIPELFYLPKNLTSLELKNIVDQFIKERGKLFNQGICFKQAFNDLLKHEDKIVEYRLFYLNGQFISCSLNIDGDNLDDILNLDSMSRIDCQNYFDGLLNESNFFTVDIAYSTENKKWIVLETGDGQVSGLAAQCNPMIFYYQLSDKLK